MSPFVDTNTLVSVNAPRCGPCALPMRAQNRYLWRYWLMLGIGIAIDGCDFYAMLIHVAGIYVGPFMIIACTTFFFWHTTDQEAVWRCEECGKVKEIEDSEGWVVVPNEPQRFRRLNPGELLKARVRGAFWGTFLVLAQVALLNIVWFKIFSSF